MNTLKLSAMPVIWTVFVAVMTSGAGRAFPPGGAAPPESKDDKALALKVPEALRLRHEAFIAEFTRVTKDSGKVGDAARSMEKLAAAHFAKGKEVFKPLSLLPLLAEGQVPPDQAKAREIAESLRKNLPQIRREHSDLIAGLKRLAEAAKDEAKSEYAAFAERLILHIREEEEVLYPAVLLVGEHVKEKLGKEP